MTRNGAVATFGQGSKIEAASAAPERKSKSSIRRVLNVTSSGDNAASTFPPEHFPAYRRLLTDAIVGQCSACRQPADVYLAGLPPDCSRLSDIRIAHNLQTRRIIAHTRYREREILIRSHLIPARNFPRPLLISSQLFLYAERTVRSGGGPSYRVTTAGS